MTFNNGHPSPKAYPREHATCGRCVRCHPGKAWGGDENCRKADCACHSIWRRMGAPS